MKGIIHAWSIAVVLMACAAAFAQTPAPTHDLTTASLEELMKIEVTSVSKKEEKLFQSTAAIYVITQEEIRRSGLTSVPELLRLVPGLQVARLDGNKWTISARGFNARFANKLLVLVDGRSVYTPVFSGVYWEIQQLPIEEIERIEVIRGPGGTLWGANAVNGVINIITKRASDSQGGRISETASKPSRQRRRRAARDLPSRLNRTDQNRRASESRHSRPTSPQVAGEQASG